MNMIGVDGYSSYEFLAENANTVSSKKSQEEQKKCCVGLIALTPDLLPYFRIVS